jgi:low affinity Fe/Cu permease
VKLDELILAPKNARNDLVAVEEQPEDKIEKIKDDEKMRARK